MPPRACKASSNVSAGARSFWSKCLGASGFEFCVEVKATLLSNKWGNVWFLRKILEEKEEAVATMKEESWSGELGKKLICAICLMESQQNPCCCILVFWYCFVNSVWERHGNVCIYLRLIWLRKETPWKVKPKASRNDYAEANVRTTSDGGKGPPASWESLRSQG